MNKYYIVKVATRTYEHSSVKAQIQSFRDVKSVIEISGLRVLILLIVLAVAIGGHLF